jgi:hypothetical protein
MTTRRRLCTFLPQRADVSDVGAARRGHRRPPRPGSASPRISRNARSTAILPPVAIASLSSFIAERSELSDEELRAVVAVAGYRVLWQGGPSLPWLSSRMGWPEAQSRIELEHLQRNGLVCRQRRPGAARQVRGGRARTRRLARLERADERRRSSPGASRERRRRRPQSD